MTDIQQFRNLEQSWEEMPSAPALSRGTNLPAAHMHNRKIILHAIRARGEITRGALVALTGLTSPAIFQISKNLLRDGLIVGVRVNKKARGQPTHALRLNPDAAFTLGVSMDHDHISLVVVDFLGNVRKRFHCSTSSAGPKEIRAFVGDCVCKIEAGKEVLIDKVIGIGVAIPGGLDLCSKNQKPANFEEWAGIKRGTTFNDILNVPVVHENDAAAAAIGEMLFASGLALDSFFYVFMSTGLGGALVINRQHVRGAHGRSGEIGFLPQINLLRRSQTDLQKTLNDAVLLSSLLDALRANGHEINSPDDLDMFDLDRNEIVQKWIDTVADYLLLPLLTIFHTIDPNAILIGGHLPRRLVERICHEINRRLSMYVGTQWPRMPVRPASFSNDPAAIGAAVLAFRDIWEPAPRGPLQTPNL